MTPRRKVSRPRPVKERRIKAIGFDWDGLAPEHRVFFGSFEEQNPEWALGTNTPDLHRVAEAMANDKVDLLKLHLKIPANVLDDIPGGSKYLVGKNPRDVTLQLPEWAWLILGEAIQTTLKAGFYFAVMRYADDLRQVSELAALLEQRRVAAQKGGAGRRKKAEPNHKKIRKLFREMRKTTPKKTVRYLRIADEFEMSDRQIARIVEGLD